MPGKTSGVGMVRGLGGRAWNLVQSLCDKWLAPRVDGVIVISEYLMRKYEALGCGNMLLVPTLVDVRDWQLGEAKDGLPEFFYAGESTQGLYEFSNMLRAFARMRAKGARFRVALVMGRPEAFGSVATLQQEVEGLGLGDRVEFLDFMPLEALKARMAQASFLLCLRKDTDLARSGASTKLSEYFATGRVVILTPVGDISRSLEDGVNSLVAANTEVEVIQSTFEAALALGLQERASVGGRGRELAARLFSPTKASDALGAFLRALVRAGKS